MVGPGPGPSVQFPDRDPVFVRPAKSLRITGKSSALRREPFSGDGGMDMVSLLALVRVVTISFSLPPS